MDAIKFSQCNVTFAKNQPEYHTLYAHRTEDGVVTSCWRLSFRERVKVLFGGTVWLQVLTFNKGLQPVKMLIHNPLKPRK